MIQIIDKIRLMIAKVAFRLYKNCPKYLFEQDYLRKKGVELKSRKMGFEINYPIEGKNTCFYIRKKASDSAVFRQVVLEGEYQPIIELIRSNDDNIKHIFDLGANIGLTSIYLGVFFPNAKIISLEPESSNFEILSLNTKKNKNIFPINAGIWHKDSKLELKRDFRDKRDWSFYLTESEKGDINAFSIESIMNKERINQIDLLKIDIEGGEKHLFDTENKYMFLNSVKYICIEIHDELNVRANILNALDENNFDYFEKGETLFGVNNKLNYS